MPQLRVVPGMQAPVPLQLAAPDSVEPAQVRGRQKLPAGYSWQTPAPSHLPVRPQVLGASMAQPAVRGSAPAGRLRHEPSAPGRLQVRQGPLHSAVSQQTPSTQLLELQSVPVAQGAPSGLRPQDPFTHALPPAQS